MASRSENRALEPQGLQPNDKDEKYADESSAPSAQPSPPNEAEDSLSNNEETTYPEGGFQAWLVVLGAFCGTAASIGLYNTSGLFEAYMSTQLLPNESTSKVGWIFGIYAFVTWFLGVQVGPTFDAMGPTRLMLAGSVCTLGGILALSACTGDWTSFLRAMIKTEIGTDYYQIILAFSLLTGAGTSLIMNPAVASVAHWFNEGCGLASGIAWTGSGIGGVIFPLMIQSLLPQVGWAWSLRAFGLILFVLCTVSVALCRSRVPPRNGDATTWRDTIPSARIFLDGTGAMALTTAGAVLTDLAYFIPVTFIPSYYVARQYLPPDATLTGTASFAYQLLAILNGSSCVGRLLAVHAVRSLQRTIRQRGYPIRMQSTALSQPCSPLNIVQIIVIHRITG
ncbi:MAG: hypothetical protein Q9164_005482 [Protoblastenia rupestris]